MTNGNDSINGFTYTGTDIYGNPGEQVESGLTKREYFAAMAMQGWIACQSNDFKGDEFMCAERAVVWADALITELNKTK